jgi:5-methylcytosine-specific restriction endonuclease McrA
MRPDVASEPDFIPMQEIWKHFYDTAFWQRRRKQQLLAHPLCKMCAARGAVISIATVVDHVEPHKGDWNLFALGELQSLCASCHNSAKRFIELRGHSIEVGDDGWPTDPKHPANKR